jgi:hypothetical protein
MSLKSFLGRLRKHTADLPNMGLIIQNKKGFFFYHVIAVSRIMAEYIPSMYVARQDLPFSDVRKHARSRSAGCPGQG